MRFEKALVSSFFIMCAILSLTMLLAAAGGTSKGDQMPWLNMLPYLDEQDMQMREYPFELPFPPEIETAPKGVESLTVAQLAVLKESFIHQRNPITFHKIDRGELFNVY